MTHPRLHSELGLVLHRWSTRSTINHLEGYAHGYPDRIVDHAHERAEALARYAELRGRRYKD